MASPERVDAVAWALLTLHAHIDMHVKRFKVSLHGIHGMSFGGDPVQLKPSCS